MESQNGNEWQPAPAPPTWDDEDLQQLRWQDHEGYWQQRPWPGSYASPVEYLQALRAWSERFELSPVTGQEAVSEWLGEHGAGPGVVETGLPGGGRYTGPAWLAGYVYLAVEEVVEQERRAREQARAGQLVDAFLASLTDEEAASVRLYWLLRDPAAGGDDDC